MHVRCWVSRICWTVPILAKILSQVSPRSTARRIRSIRPLILISDQLRLSSMHPIIPHLLPRDLHCPTMQRLPLDVRLILRRRNVIPLGLRVPHGESTGWVGLSMWCTSGVLCSIAVDAGKCPCEHGHVSNRLHEIAHLFRGGMRLKGLKGSVRVLKRYVRLFWMVPRHHRLRTPRGCKQRSIGSQSVRG